jgi:pimeloyl-ACP methyl ester carboxylesterase
MAGVRGRSGPDHGTSRTGMEFVVWGSGPRTMLFVPGGPGSSVSGRLSTWSRGRFFAPYVDAGYAVWLVTRRRGMPLAHTLADIADDHADLVRTEVGGRVDLVVAESFGGMVAQHLAAAHPNVLGALVLVATGWQVTPETQEVDGRLVAALRDGDRSRAGAVFAEYALPGARLAGLRRLLAPVTTALLLSGRHFPVQDVLVEAEAERLCDTRALLPGIKVPTLVVAGDRDRFFSPAVVEETARLVGARLVWRPGKGHAAVCASRETARLALDLGARA